MEIGMGQMLIEIEMLPMKTIHFLHSIGLELELNQRNIKHKPEFVMDDVVEGAPLADPDLVPEVVSDPLLDPELEFELLMLMLAEIDGTKQNASTRWLSRSETQREFCATLKKGSCGKLRVMAEGLGCPWLGLLGLVVREGWPSTRVADCPLVNELALLNTITRCFGLD